jgi:multiple sugar transport system permease protein
MTRSERATLWLMATPFLLGVAALVVGPALWTLVMAFTDANLIRPPAFVGLANLRELFGDPMFRLALRNSMLFAAVAVPLRLGLALGVALLLARPARRSWRRPRSPRWRWRSRSCGSSTRCTAR